MSRAPHYHYKTAVVGALSAIDAGRLMGQNLSCSGIHLPDDPKPSTLSGDARRLWDAAYKNANAYYNETNSPKNEKTANKTAWKTVRLFFVQDGKKWSRRAALPPVRQGPVTYVGNPGDVVDLGAILEYTFIDGDANLQIIRFADGDAPSLFWSERNRTLYVFPTAENESCRKPDPWSSESVMFKRWAQREPQCERVLDVPEVDVQLLGNLDTIIYRSDKWHDRNPDPSVAGSQEYIHQVGDGVGLWQSAGNPPAAIVMTGGCLDVEERGIIH
jgi:hypothetical protein